MVYVRGTLDKYIRNPSNNQLSFTLRGRKIVTHNSKYDVTKLLHHLFVNRLPGFLSLFKLLWRFMKNCCRRKNELGRSCLHTWFSSCSIDIHDHFPNSCLSVPSPRRFISSSFPVNFMRNLFTSFMIDQLNAEAWRGNNIIHIRWSILWSWKKEKVTNYVQFFED